MWFYKKMQAGAKCYFISRKFMLAANTNFEVFFEV